MHRRLLFWLAAGLIAASAGFLFWQLRQPVAFILELRATKLAALICVGAATGAATILFQTVAMNRLLTPGIVGFDALFVLIQTLLVATLGGVGMSQLPAGIRFFVEAGVLMAAASALFGLLLRRDASDITRMILTGVILGILLRGLATLVQRMMDPSEFAVLQQAMFASFGSVDKGQLYASAGVLIAGFAVAMRFSPALDVAALGRDKSRGLGLEHDRLVLLSLFVIAALVSVSTALVGPITFFGLLAASLARHLTDTHRHAILLPAAAMIGALILVFGQFVFERLLSSQSALAVVVEFFGGILFLFFVLRGGRS